MNICVVLAVVGVVILIVAYYLRGYQIVHEATVAIGLSCGILSIVLSLGIFCSKLDNKAQSEKVDYEVFRVNHYHAYNAEELNQVWLKDKDGDYFYVIITDNQYAEYKKVLDDNTVVLSLSEKDFSDEVMRSK